MRPLQGEILPAPRTLSHLPPPQPPPETCDPSTCQWRPANAASSDFEANVVMVLIVLLCALICALALNGAIRCFLRSNRQSPAGGNEISDSSGTRPEIRHKQAFGAVTHPPPVAYSAGLKLAGAGKDCAICLAEFVEGDGVRVLESCKHGFHAQCIERWLRTHSSCPNCRRSCCLAASSSSSDSSEIAERSENCRDDGGGRQGSPSLEVAESGPLRL